MAIEKKKRGPKLGEKKSTAKTTAWTRQKGCKKGGGSGKKGRRRDQASQIKMP